MTREECNWRLVQAGPSVDVHSVGDILRGLANVCQRRMDSFVLTSWREQQAAIGGKRETSEEGGQCLVEVDGCVANT